VVMASFLRITLTSVRAFPPLVSLGRVLDSGEVFLDSGTCCGSWELAKLTLIDTRGCVGLGNLDLKFKIRISDLQPNAISTPRYLFLNSLFFHFLGNLKKDLKNSSSEQQSCTRKHN